jgi:hypothetical protein
MQPQDRPCAGGTHVLGTTYPFTLRVEGVEQEFCGAHCALNWLASQRASSTNIERYRLLGSRLVKA